MHSPRVGPAHQYQTSHAAHNQQQNPAFPVQIVLETALNAIDFRTGFRPPTESTCPPSEASLRRLRPVAAHARSVPDNT
eukprot:2946554-Rhodomonas_salina.1